MPSGDTCTRCTRQIPSPGLRSRIYHGLSGIANFYISFSLSTGRAVFLSPPRVSQRTLSNNKLIATAAVYQAIPSHFHSQPVIYYFLLPRIFFFVCLSRFDIFLCLVPPFFNTTFFWNLPDSRLTSDICISPSCCRGRAEVRTVSFALGTGTWVLTCPVTYFSCPRSALPLGSKPTAAHPGFRSSCRSWTRRPHHHHYTHYRDALT
jgi:hypothetical protein